MYVKLHNPKDMEHGNKGSCSKLAEYLEKENEVLALEDRRMFFNNNGDDHSLADVIKGIDNNKLGLGKNDSKYFMLSINPSEAEHKQIISKITDRKVFDISDLTKDELKQYDHHLKDYANDVMDRYAENFDRGLTKDDLVYFGKVEHERHISRDKDKLLEEREQHIKLDSTDIDKVKFNSYYYADEKCRDICHGLKKHDHNAIRTASAEMVKNIPDNAIIVPMPSSPGYATYTKDMCDEIKKLNPSLDVKDVLKCNSRDQLYELKQKGFEADSKYFNFHLDGSLPKDRPVYLVDNVLATGTTFKHAQEVVPNANLAVYGINEDTKIKAEKITERDKLKNLDIEKKGDLKAGFQSHVHVIVSRKDITNSTKLSPFANAKSALNEMPNGEKAQIGFNRDKFTQSCEKTFDNKFDFNRAKDQFYKFHNTMANKLSSFTENFIVPEELAPAYTIGKDIYSIGKALNFKDINKDIANYLKNNFKTINQFSVSASNFAVQSKTLAHELKDNISEFNKLPDTLQKKVYLHQNKIDDIFTKQKEAVKDINVKIKETFNDKNWKNLKKFKVEKNKIIEPFKSEILNQQAHISKLLKDNKVNLSSYRVTSVSNEFYSQMSGISKELNSISNSISDVHSKADFLKGDINKMDKKDLFKNLENLKESNFSMYGIDKKLSSIQAKLEPIRSDLYKSLRSVETKIKSYDNKLALNAEAKNFKLGNINNQVKPIQKNINSSIRNFKDNNLNNLQNAKKDILFKCDVVKRCNNNIKFEKGYIFNSSRMVTNANLARNPMQGMKEILSKIPVGREVMGALNLATNANPAKLAATIAKKLVTGLVQAGMGV